MYDSTIFVCYLRDDGAAWAHRLCVALVARYGEDRVSWDVGAIPGSNVVEYIDQRLSSCQVLLVVIGPRWLTLVREREQSSPDHNHVRIEIESALGSQTKIVPVLVGRAGMPSREELGGGLERLRPLADLRDLELSDQYWEPGMDRLEATLASFGVTPLAPVSRWWRRRWVAPAIAAALLLALIPAGIAFVGDTSRVVYSSLPQLDSVGAPNKRTRDMENAIRLALGEAEGRAGDVKITYEALNASDSPSVPNGQAVQGNARKVADHDDAAVYIGDHNSGASQQSIPILSAARVPQISPASSKIGLTTSDPRGDDNEPGIYYPPQPPDFPEGYRNFVRVIPRDSVQAVEVLRLMKNNRCRSFALVNDNSAYGQSLAGNILDANRGPSRVPVVFAEPVTPRGRFSHLVSKAANGRLKADCVVYSGDRNPNTVELFESFARALPTAKLYGTDGVGEASFYDYRRGGMEPELAMRVKLMVPPRDSDEYSRFIKAFRAKYPGPRPDPYALYAYAAMKLALTAIKDSTGERDSILRALRATTKRQDALGTYSIDSNGDTTLKCYGVSKIRDGALTTPKNTRTPC